MTHNADVSVMEEINRLTEQNEQLKDELFVLLHEQHDVSDASIRDAYRDLRGSIEFWVDNVIGDSRSSSPGKHRRDVEQREYTLLKDFGVPSALIEEGRGYPYFLLSLAVQRELQQRIFDKEYPLGITDQQADVIDQVLDGMNNLESGKERLIRERWRSEAVRALTAREDFERRKYHDLHDITTEAADVISPKSGASLCGLDHRAFEQHNDIFNNEIFEAAATLHQNMCGSVHRYEMFQPPVGTEMNAERMLEKGWMLKDMTKWVDIRKINSPIRCICPIYPSLVHHLDNDGDPLILVQPVIVVHPKGSGRSSPSRSARRSPTHSISSDSTTKDAVNYRENRSMPDYTTDTDLTRLREQGRINEYSKPQALHSDGTLFGASIKWLSGKSNLKGKTKYRGKGEYPLPPGSPTSVRPEPEHRSSRGHSHRESDREFSRGRRNSGRMRTTDAEERASGGDRHHSKERRSPDRDSEYTQISRSPDHYDEHMRQRRNSGT